MKLHKTLTDLGAVKEEYFGYPYRIETKTGTLGINFRHNRLFCNFVGSEERAKVKFGHWKQNSATIQTEQDIINHINKLKG